jgi:hypothetical protein
VTWEEPVDRSAADFPEYDFWLGVIEESGAKPESGSRKQKYSEGIELANLT